MKQTLEDAVLKAVTWWSDKSFRTTLNQNNGDNTLLGGLTNVRMNTASIIAQDGIDDEKIKKFESKLTELLMNAKNSYNRSLSVDYHPCEHLFVAAEFAGINSSCFPCKSSTSIDENNRAFAKYQYGGEYKEI
jgi:hypothetical protein